MLDCPDRPSVITKVLIRRRQEIKVEIGDVMMEARDYSGVR